MIDTQQLIDFLSEKLAYETETVMLDHIRDLIAETNRKRRNLGRESGVIAHIAKTPVWDGKIFVGIKQ